MSHLNHHVIVAYWSSEVCQYSIRHD